MDLRNMTFDLRRRRSSLQVILLTTAWLMALPCFGQLQDLTAEPASVSGRMAGLALQKEFPKAEPQAGGFMHNAEQPLLRAEESRELKNTAYQNLQALAQAQVVAPAAVSSNTVPAILSFYPPNTFDESSCAGFRIANGGLAVSANYLLEAGTSCVKILNPSTGAVIAGPTSLGKFFGSSGSTASARALYDSVNGRFLVSAEDYQSNEIYVAVSQTSNPTLGWNIYSFPMIESCSSADNPKLGQTNLEAGDSLGAIYLAWDVYCPPNGPSNFVGAISKSLAYSGAPISTINGFVGLNIGGVYVDYVQPANVMNPGDHPRGEFLLNSFDWHFGGGKCVNGCNGVVVWDFYNGIPASGGSQSITGVVVSTANTYYLPPNAPEPGCAVNTCGPSTGGPVMGGEVTYSAGSLFGALNDGMGILAVELEPEVNDAGAITGALMRNEICFACGGFSNGGQAYDGAIQPDSERNWVMVYNVSAPGSSGCTPNASTCIYPSTAFVTRRVTQAQNTVDDNGSILALGQAYYSQTNSYKQNAWANYSAVAPNYGASNSYWFDAEYVESNGNWGTVVGETGFTSPTQP